MFIITIAVIELNESSTVQHKVAIESVLESESFENKPLNDATCLVNAFIAKPLNHNDITVFAKKLNSTSANKELFRPPRLV